MFTIRNIYIILSCVIDNNNFAVDFHVVPSNCPSSCSNPQACWTYSGVLYLFTRVFVNTIYVYNNSNNRFHFNDHTHTQTCAHTHTYAAHCTEHTHHIISSSPRYTQALAEHPDIIIHAVFVYTFKKYAILCARVCVLYTYIIYYIIFTVKVHVAFTFPSWLHCHVTFSRYYIIIWSSSVVA